MRKILMVTERYVPIWGGAENQLRQLIPYIVDSGFQVSVVTRRWRREMEKNEIVDGVSVFRLGVPGRNPAATLLFIFHLLFFLIFSGRRFDVYHSHGVVKMGVLCRIGAMCTGANNIVKIATAGKVKPLQSSILGRFILRLFKQSDGVVCMTREIRKELDSVGFPRDNVFPIPNAVDCNRFYPERNVLKRRQFRHKLGIPEDARLVLFSGRLVSRKGVDVLISAWDQLQDISDLYLLVLGSGTDQVDSVERDVHIYVKEKGLQRLYFLGEKDHPEKFLANCDIFVFPSRLEGFPNALMEAMASELPVIVSRIGGNIDLVVENESGLFFEKDNAQELAECIGTLHVNDVKMSCLGRSARRQMLESYNFTAIGDLYCDLYIHVSSAECYAGLK